MRQMLGFDDLRQQRRMSWMVHQQGWVAVPEEIVKAFSNAGFEECTRKPTTSRRDRLPAGGLWQGVHPRTGSAASASWVNRPARHYTLVFIEVDGESLTGGDSVRGERGRPSGRAGQDPSTTFHGATTGNGGQRESEQAAHPRSEVRAITA
jgi:hypothetical protein